MKKITLKNRILSGILALVTLISLVPVQSWGTESAAEEQVTIAEASSLQVTRAGAKIRTIRLAAHERIEINAENGSAAASYQWQILHPHRENVWINIYDATHGYLFVTLALVRNMMTDDNIAILRCRVTEDEQVRYTDPVTVQFCPEQEYIPEPTPTEPPEAVMEPVLHPETTEPTVPETTAPAETEAPTVPETTAPAETEAPTVPETTASAETEAPTVPETTAPAETEAPTVPETTAPAETEAPTVPENAAPAETEVPAVPETTAPAETLAPVVPETQPLMVEEILVELPAKQMEAAMAVAETAPAETEAPTTTEPVPMETNQDTEVDLSAADDSEIPDDNEFVSVTIEYIRYDFARDANGKLIAQPNNPGGWTDPKYRGGYLLEQEGRVAFNSYIATLQSGTDLNTTVPVPTMMGYDTYLQGSYAETVSTVSISLTNITQNVVYQVEYLPAAVPYTVRYYFQNIYDDLYVENASLKVETTGHTGSTPPDTILKKEVDGFLPLYYQPDAIAADGSTVFEVYYERNYYLMEFDCTGGYGAETLYNRFGSYINVPNPVRSGYIFAGWDRMVKNSEGKYVNGDGVADPLPEVMPMENTAYQALWRTNQTTYTVVYWAENANDTGYSYWGSKTVNAESNSLVSGTEHRTVTGLPNTAYFTYNPVKTQVEEAKRTDLRDGKVVVQGDGSTVVNVYYSRNYYTITFKATGTCTAHVHGTDCEYRLLCGQDNHVHDDTCVKTLICEIPEHKGHTADCIACGFVEEHTHGNTCIGCGKTEHSHSVECCTVTPHTHTIECYDPYNGWELAENQSGFTNTISNISNPSAGYVYKYRQSRNSYYNYFYDGAKWYYLGTANEYRNLINNSNISNPNSNGYYTVSNVAASLECGLTVHDHTSGCVYCSLEEHTHTNSCVTCGKTEHTHSDTCYSDTLHNHNDSCYHYSCGYVHEHTAACYGSCIYPNHTHSSNCYSSSRTNTVKLVTRKYGADISDIWPIIDDHGVTYNGGQRWSPSDSSYYSQVLVFLKTMPGDDFTLTVNTSTNNTYVMHYYVEVLDGEAYEREYNGKKFKLAFEPVSAKYGYVTKNEDFFDIEGFTQWTSSPAFSSNNQISINGGGNVYFYYTRSTHTLKFHNYNVELTDKQKTIQYEKTLGDYEIIAGDVPYPSTLEPDAYFFDGWYTTPECFDGSAVDWNIIKMPNDDLTLYAKWTPIKRNVTFYTFYSDIGLKAGDEGYDAALMPFLAATNVPHGSVLGSAYNKIPSATDDSRVTDYQFIGWFYLDEDNKKRFAPDTMEITRDLVLFAEWKTQVDTTYEVRYVLRDDVGAENTLDGKAYSAGTPVADMIFAHSSVGKTKTFQAKALGDLYPAFQKQFYPLSNSHSILMQEDESQNTYTFEYVFDDTVYYKVRYLEAGTNKVLLDEVVKSTEEAVVTEKFKPKSGYIPQRYYIRKTLAYDGTATENTVIAENVITFYYVQDKTHGVYSVEYYLENADSTDSTNTKNYTQYESIVGVADLNTTIPTAGTTFVRAYEGYTYDSGMTEVINYNNDGSPKNPVKNGTASGKVDVNGLTIKLYYKRNQYPYIIEYREYGAAADADALKTVVNGTLANFDSQVTYVLTQDTAYNHAKNTIEINGKIYEYYIAAPAEADITKSITIRAFDEGETNPNKMVFYFVQKQVEVHYEVVEQNSAVTGLCQVSMKSERATAAANLSGSSAMTAEGFRFVGWYLDEKCTAPVDPAWLLEEGKKLKPQTLDTTKDDIYYYALFEPVELAVTYDPNGGEPVDGQTSKIGETVTLRPATTRANYTQTSWWYDANGDGKIDTGEEYAPGGSFTMPGKNVRFVAQWIDSRMDNKHRVFVGLNMSFYNSGHNYYYKFPPGEPTQVELEAARAYISSIDADGKNTWAVQEGYWDKALCKPGELNVAAEPRDYIDPAIMEPGTLVTNGNVIGVFDGTGEKTKELLYFTQNDYDAIVQAWLNAREYFKNRFASYNINWDLLPMDADLYEAVPYVIKRHWHGLTKEQDWFIDFVILPKNRFNVTYNLDLPDGYEATAPVDPNLYGQGMYVNVIKGEDVPYTADNRYVAKFVGWEAKDANGNTVTINSNNNKFTMPGSNVTLTAKWEFCAPLTISQTGMNDNESSIYRVTGNGVDLTVAITGNDQVTILDLPLGDYTVTEQTNWSWTSKSEGSTEQTVTLKMPAEANAETDNNPAIFNNTPKTVLEYRWLHGESSRDNKFAAVN